MSAFFLSHPSEADLALFAGGELGPLSRWRIERHIESCERCHAVVSEFFRLQGDLNELGEAPELDWVAFRQSIQAEVATARDVAQEPASRQGWMWQFGLAAASVVCAVAVWNDWRAPSEQPAVSSSSQPQVELQVEQDEVARVEQTTAEPEQLAEAVAAPVTTQNTLVENTPTAAKELKKAEQTAKETQPARVRQFSDRLVAASAAPPPPTAPYEVRARPLVEAREADGLGQATSVDLRQEAAPLAKQVNAQLDERSDLRDRLQAVLEREGPEGVRHALELGRTTGTRERADAEVNQAERQRLLRLLDSEGLQAVVEDLTKW